MKAFAGLAAVRLGMSGYLAGVFIVAMIGDAAEHGPLAPGNNKMDLPVTIAVGPSLQIALLVAPLLVLLSYPFGKPPDLLFTTFEIAAIVLSAGALNRSRRRIELNGGNSARGRRFRD